MMSLITVYNLLSFITTENVLKLSIFIQVSLCQGYFVSGN